MLLESRNALYAPENTEFSYAMLRDVHKADCYESVAFEGEATWIVGLESLPIETCIQGIESIFTRLGRVVCEIVCFSY